jgi:hypothetical protein
VVKQPPSAEGTKQSQLLPRPNIQTTEDNMAVQISDGNAFAIIAAGQRELKKLGRHDEIAAFTEEMTAGDYAQLLFTFVRWFPEAELVQ